MTFALQNVKLNNGEECERSVSDAINTGHRLIDTAASCHRSPAMIKWLGERKTRYLNQLKTKYRCKNEH